MVGVRLKGRTCLKDGTIYIARVDTAGGRARAKYAPHVTAYETGRCVDLRTEACGPEALFSLSTKLSSQRVEMDDTHGEQNWWTR